MMLKGTDILHITRNIILNRVGSLPHWACSLFEKKRKQKGKFFSLLFYFLFYLSVALLVDALE